MAECLHFPDEDDPEELPFGAIEEDKDNVTCKAPLSFGYDENFISPVDDDLQCSICFLPLREPVLTRCGHRFCRECLEHHMTRFVNNLKEIHLYPKYSGILKKETDHES